MAGFALSITELAIAQPNRLVSNYDKQSKKSDRSKGTAAKHSHHGNQNSQSCKEQSKGIAWFRHCNNWSIFSDVTNDKHMCKQQQCFVLYELTGRWKPAGKLYVHTQNSAVEKYILIQTYDIFALCSYL
jgi:hypothetical protein